MLWSIHLVSLLLGFGLSAVAAQQTACHPDVRGIDGGARCLSLIRQKALDTSAFNTVCLPEVSDVEGCRAESRFPNQPNSLSMLVFGTPCSVDPLSGLDRYLSVRYTAPTGGYEACDYQYHTQDVIEFESDPLSDSMVDSYIIRQMPRLSWPAETGELFTLLFMNLDRTIIHLGFANIRGNDIANALVLRSYGGANTYWKDPLLYAYFLYKQMEPLGSDSVPQRRTVNITDFAQTHRLEGPVAINWMVVDAVDAVERTNMLHTQPKCPLMIQRALENNSPDLPFLTRPYNLRVHLRVRFTTEEFTYNCGPLSITHPGSDFYLDPIGNSIYNVADIRTDSTQTLTMDFPNGEDFAGKLYTMLMIDEDNPNIHGLSINIHGDDVRSGTVIRPYREPLPPSVHTYYFLLYQQEAELSLTATAAFTRTTCPSSRCIHGVIQAFISVNGLQLVGATWMRADNDDYVRCRKNA